MQAGYIRRRTIYKRTIYKRTIRRWVIYKCTIRRRTIYKRTIYAGGLYTQAGYIRRRVIYAYYMLAYYICIYTFYYIIHTPRKNLFKINALPKILEKTCLKSMLCLFLDAMPKMGILVLGIGKSFKINNLRLIWGCCAHDSQNFGEGGGD